MTLEKVLKDYITGVRHTGFVVDDLDATIASFVRVYGIDPESVRFVPADPNADSPVRFAFLSIADLQFEIIQPCSDEQRALLEQYASGPGGINHIAWEVSDLDACLAILDEQGVGPGHVTPDGPFEYFNSRSVYLDPASCGGLLIELHEVRE